VDDGELHTEQSPPLHRLPSHRLPPTVSPSLGDRGACPGELRGIDEARALIIRVEIRIIGQNLFWLHSRTHQLQQRFDRIKHAANAGFSYPLPATRYSPGHFAGVFQATEKFTLRTRVPSAFLMLPVSIVNPAIASFSCTSSRTVSPG
jgi:hypothetical protein